MLHSYVRAAATCTAYRLIGSLNRSYETHYLWQLALQLHLACKLEPRLHLGGLPLRPTRRKAKAHALEHPDQPTLNLSSAQRGILSVKSTGDEISIH